MAYVITDINDFEFTIDDGFRTIEIWKQNVRFGDIVGDVLTLYWHNKAQTDTQYELAIDYNDVTAPVVASAADLQTALEGMISSGWAPAPQDEYFTILLGHSNTSPNDTTPLWFGQRLSSTAEGEKFNNPAVIPVDCIIEKVVMSWRCTTGSAAGDVIDFYVSVWDGANPPVELSDTVALSAALIVLAGMNSYWAVSGTLSIAASAGNVVWMHYVGPYATNPTGVLLTATLFCKRT